MANILESPITLGAIQGMLDTAIQSRQALRKEKQLKEEAAAEAKKSAQGDLFSFLTNKDNHGLANAFMQDGQNLPLFLGFQPEQQEAIFLNAHRTDQELPANQKTVFDTVMGDQNLASEVMGVWNRYTSKGVFSAMQDYSKTLNRQLTPDDFLDIGLQVGMAIDPEDFQLASTVNSLPSSYITMMQAFATQDKMTQNEVKLFNGLPEDPQKKVAEARNLLNGGAARPGSKFEALLVSTVRMPIPEKPYERISNDERDDLAALFTGKDGELKSEIIAPALETVNALKNKIIEKHLKKEKDDQGNVSYSGPRGAVLDVMFLDGLESKYGTADSLLAGEETADQIIKMLDDGVQNLSKFSDDEVSQKVQAAKNVLGNIAAFAGDPGVLQDADAVTPGFQVSPSIPARAHADLLTLISASSLVEKVAKDSYSFSSNNKNINVETGKALEEDPTAFLLQLNTRIASINYGSENSQGEPREVGDNGFDFYSAMTADERQKFEARVTAALKLDYALQMQASYKGEDKVREAPGPRDYAFDFGELYSLPFVQTLVHDVFKQPKPDETMTGRRTNPTPQLDPSGVELSEDQYALTPTTILQVTPAVKSLAARQGVTTHDFFNNSDLNYRMIEASNFDNPFYLFEAADVISGMGFFSTRKDAPLRQKDAAAIGQVLARFGITDRNDQLDVLSVAMSADLPQGVQPQKGRTTLSLNQTNDMFALLTGSNISDKKLQQRRDADNEFIKQGKLVASLLEQQPSGSRLSTDIIVKFSNLFLIDDSLAKQALRAGGKALETLGLYNPDDYESQAQRERIEAATESFLRQEFLENDAQLASALVKFAYNFAKTMDEAGRISERDYIAALKAVNADFLSNKEVRMSVVEGLIKQTQDSIVRHNQIFDLKMSMRQGQRFFMPTRSQIKQMRALRYFGNLTQVTQGLEDVVEFQEYFSSTGAPSVTAGFNPLNRQFANLQGRYDVKFADDVFGPSATQPGTYVYRVRKKIFADSDPVDFVRGVPMYINGQGELLSQEEIRARTGAQ